MPLKNKIIYVSFSFLMCCAFLLSCTTDMPKENVSLIDSVIDETSWVYNDAVNKEQAVKKLQHLLDHDKQLPLQSRYKIYHSLYFYNFCF